MTGSVYLHTVIAGHCKIRVEQDQEVAHIVILLEKRKRKAQLICTAEPCAAEQQAMDTMKNTCQQNTDRNSVLRAHP